MAQRFGDRPFALDMQQGTSAACMHTHKLTPCAPPDSALLLLLTPPSQGLQLHLEASHLYMNFEYPSGQAALALTGGSRVAPLTMLLRVRLGGSVRAMAVASPEAYRPLQVNPDRWVTRRTQVPRGVRAGCP